MNESAEQSTSATGAPPTLTPLPAPDPLEVLRGENATLADKLRRAEQRIVALDEKCAKQKATLEKIDANPLILALRHLDAGAVLVEAGEKTAALFAACQTIGGKGKIAVTLAVEPSEGRNRAMVYEAEIKVTDPKEEATTAFIFVTPDGKLTREQWGERDLPLSRAAQEED